MIPDAKIDNPAFWHILDLTVTFLSFSGSLLMSYYCFRLPSPTSTSIKLILATAIADFFFTISNVLSNFQSQTKPALCQTEAMLRSSSMFLSILFTTCAAIVSARASTSFNSRRFLRNALFIGITYSICLALGPYFFPNHIAYTYGPLFCWVSYKPTIADESRKLLAFMLYEGLPVILGTLVTLFGYLNVVKRMKRLPGNFLEKMDVSLHQVLWYPFVLFITFVPIVVENIIRIYEPERPTWKKALTLTFTHAIGFFNAVVYIIQRKLYDNMKPLNPLTISKTNTSDSLLVNDRIDSSLYI